MRVGLGKYSGYGYSMELPDGACEGLHDFSVRPLANELHKIFTW